MIYAIALAVMLASGAVACLCAAVIVIGMAWEKYDANNE